MNKKRSRFSNNIHSENPNKILELYDLYFPGDEAGNRLGSIEAWAKTYVEINQLNKEFSDSLIVTTTDKLKNQLIDFFKVNTETKDLIAPFGTALSLVVAIVTSDCKAALGLPAETWEVLLIVFLFSSILWLIVLLIKLINNKNKRNINNLIKKIKKREDL